jgi:predicted ATPase
VQEGLGQVVLLSGEPGIGKSRLVGVLKDHVADQPQTRLECRCSPYHQHSALFPLIDLLQRVLGFASEDTPDDKVRKLEAALSRDSIDLRETVPLFAALLSLPLPECYVPLALAPQRQRQKTLETLLAIILELAIQHPVLFIVEDLHWIDPSTLEFLTLLVDQVPTARVLALFTYRPEFVASWGTRAHLTPITLNRLPRRLVENLVERVAGDKALPRIVVQQVVAKTDGVPLFVEELTKMVLESSLLREDRDRYELTAPLPPLAIPTTLHDSLMARLDRLATVKEVAQLGATLGREFSYELLRAVSPLDEVTIQQALARLVEAELLYQRGVPPRATYIFKHALIQEAAYQSLLKSTRQRHHQQVARVLEERFLETTETQPEVLAHHFTEAGLSEQAIPHWQRAGERAIQRSAYVEAISHLNSGLAVLKTLPDTSNRARQELDLQIALGQALIATKGQAAAEVGLAYSRARELCQQVEETALLFRVLYGLYNFHVVRAELQTVVKLSEELLRLAQSVQDPAYLLGPHFAQGSALFHLGKFPPAREHWEQSIALYDPRQHRANASLFGFDLGVFCLCYTPHALWHLGYPAQALTKSQEALGLAQKLSHPMSQALALAYAAMLHQFRREEHAACEQAERAIAFCTEQGFAYYLAWAILIRGWTLTGQGQIEEGITQMRQGLAALRATGAELRRPYYLELLAEAYGRAGQAEGGLQLLDEALDLVHKTGEGWREAELYRLKGELFLLQAAGRGGVRTAPAKDAETCFHRALTIARGQQARSLELRAAMSLSRLWQQQGKRGQARELLAPIYGWFTEGFDTADLQEARTLLQELA